MWSSGPFALPQWGALPGDSALGPAWGLLHVLICSVPHESSALEDQGAASFPDDRDLGILLLNNDYQRRALLYKILWDEQTQMASILQECVAQVQACQSAPANPISSA